jgi:hypothetical protein
MVLCHPRWPPTSGLIEFAMCWGGAGFEPRTTFIICDWRIWELDHNLQKKVIFNLWNSGNYKPYVDPCLHPWRRSDLQ